MCSSLMFCQQQWRRAKSKGISHVCDPIFTTAFNRYNISEKTV